MDLEKNKNEDKFRLLLSELEKKYNQVKLGGGKEKIKKLEAKAKYPPRERIRRLLDEDSEWVEIGAFAGDEMYKEYGGCPSGGVVVVIGNTLIHWYQTIIKHSMACFPAFSTAEQTILQPRRTIFIDFSCSMYTMENQKDIILCLM